MSRLTLGSRVRLQNQKRTPSPPPPQLSLEIAEKAIKNNLDIVFLALLLKEPLCGEDLTKLIYEETKVLLGPSTVYPTLHELKKSKFITHETVGKRKIYVVSPPKRKEIRALIKHTMIVNHRIIQLVSDAPR